MTLENVFVRFLKVGYKFSDSFPCFYAPVEVCLVSICSEELVLVGLWCGKGIMIEYFAVQELQVINCVDNPG